jgi:O-antigen/teichoic acid export membrane protein
VNAPEDRLGGARAAGRRALSNTIYLGGSELAGKLATFAMFAVLGREHGETGLGIVLLALAYGQILMVPVNFGLDRYLLRRVSRDRTTAPELAGDVLALKVVIAIPVLALGLTGFAVFTSDERVTLAVVLASLGVLMETLAATPSDVIVAHERGAIIARIVVVQRLLAAGVGIGALAAGAGPAAVSAAFAVGAAFLLAASARAVRRRLGVRLARPALNRFRKLAANARPFGIGDVLGVLLYRLDTLLLALLATTAEVGIYGAAYRLFDATLFISNGLTSAFIPMYTYLEATTDPSVHAVYARSLKAALIALTPIALVFALTPEYVVTTLFGPSLADAATPLALLAPSVVLLALWRLAGALVASRRDPRVLIVQGAVAVALNATLNVVLIPLLGGDGAAIAMSVTMAVAALWAAVQAAPALERFRWTPLFVGPLTAAIGMALVIALAPGPELVRLLAGAVLYLALLVAVERRVAPDDLRFLRSLRTRGTRSTTST